MAHGVERTTRSARAAFAPRTPHSYNHASMTRRILPTLVVAALFLAVTSAPAQDPSTQPGQPLQPVLLGADEGPLVVPGDPPDLILEFTAKVAGYIEPCG